MQADGDKALHRRGCKHCAKQNSCLDGGVGTVCSPLWLVSGQEWDAG